MPRDPIKSQKTLRRPADLAAAGLVKPDALPELEAVAERFAVAVTPDMAELVDPTDPRDPIAAQFIPDTRELEVRPGEMADPIGDGPFTPVKGITHRYRDRVLLKPVHACPVYCRFCFRREMVGPGSEALDGAELDAALAYIAAHEEVWEVILTGGDPLVLSPRRLAEIISRLNAIPHVGLVRIHTRVPVVDPGRVTDEMVRALRGERAPTWVMLHSNHWKEMTAEARAACGRLVDSGIPMLAQTVLLRGVNDDAETLAKTFRTLASARVKPHYLHQGDLALGTGHFRTSVAEGQALMRELRGDLSGLCQPTYVLDIPGGHGKVPIGPDWIEAEGDGAWTVTDPKGGRHRYEG